MDLFFVDPSDIPLPPAEIRIRSLKAQPWSDGRRVKVSLELDPFQKPPSLELSLAGPDGKPAGGTDIIETMARLIELNLHIRGETAFGEYTLEAVLFYPRSSLESDDPGRLDGPDPLDRMVVDTARTRFMVGLS